MTQGMLKRTSQGLLVLAGVWVVHELAYLLAHPEPVMRAAVLGGHAYLDIVRLLLAPAAACALGWTAVQRARSAGLAGRLRPAQLARWQLIVFVAVEVVERIPSGLVQTIHHEPAVYLGLALLVPVAWLLVFLVGVTARVVAALGGKSPKPAHPRTSRPHWVPVPSTAPVSISIIGSLSRRGPPGSL